MKAYTIIGYSGGEHHGWNPILNCYSSLRIFEPDALIILVNNFPHPIHPNLAKDTNLRYFMNEVNYWELGGIQTSFFNNPDVDIFFFVQDGITFVNKPVDFQEDIMFWENDFRNQAPDLDKVKSWCEEYFPTLTHKYNSRSNRICHGLMCCLTKGTLQGIMDMGLKDIRVKNKAEACASECMLGFLLREYKPSIPFYNEAGPCPNLGYKNDPNKFEFMTKRALGRISGVGNSRYMDHPTFISNPGDLTYPFTPFSFQFEDKLYSCLAEALYNNSSEKYHSIYMEFYKLNRPALLEITKHRFGDFQVYGNPFNMNYYLKQFNHDMFILKHYGYYFPFIYK